LFSFPLFLDAAGTAGKGAAGKGTAGIGAVRTGTDSLW
jgi:hypothetical protein